MVFNRDIAEDVVQEVIVELYNKREQVQINTSLIAYLRKAVYYRTLNAIKQITKVEFEKEDVLHSFGNDEKDAADQLIIKESLDGVNKVIESLPSKCKYVFTLSRYEGKSYQEIADMLNISTKTVENQIAKALKIIRNYQDKDKHL